MKFSVIRSLLGCLTLLIFILNTDSLRASEATEPVGQAHQASDRLKCVINEHLNGIESQIKSGESIEDCFKDVKKALKCKDHRNSDSFCYSELQFKKLGYSNSTIAERTSEEEKAEVIKRFAVVREGLEDLLYSLIASRWINARSSCNVACIHDAVICHDSSGLGFLGLKMARAKGQDIDSFMGKDNAANAIKACARYLALFHRHQAEHSGDGCKSKYIEHQAEFFHRLSQNPIDGQKQDSKLFKLSVGKKVSETTLLTSDNIIQSFSEDIQRTYVEFIKRTRGIFEKCAGEIYRSLKNPDDSMQNYYWTTVVHGDAHRRNLFYNPDSGADLDSPERITMIDYSSIVRTYGSIGDPAEDIGRFLGSLWDWASEQQKADKYELIDALQKDFLEAYFKELGEPYNKFKDIFRENCNFYKLRYYRSIFNSDKHRKSDSSKKQLFEYWRMEMMSHKSEYVNNYETELKGTSREKVKSHLKWDCIENPEEVIDNLPDRIAVFIESAPDDSDSYLAQLHGQFQQSRTTTRTLQVAIVGMGGMGKTSLALQYAHEAIENRAYHLIWWFPSENLDVLLKESYKEILRRISPEFVREDFSQSDSLKDWKERIEKNRPPKHKWLLIYDNARSFKSLEDMIPKNENIHVVFTSRYETEWGNLPCISLSGFTSEESVSYLLTLTGIRNDEESHRTAESVANQLWNFPVALTIAANYVKLIGGDIPTGHLFEKFLKEFKTDPDFRNPLTDPASLSKRLIGNTYHILEKELGRGSEIAKRANNVMIWCSYLDPDMISEDIILEIAGHGQATEEALEKLYSLSLVQKVKADSFSVHRLIQKVIRGKWQNSDSILQVTSGVEQLFHSYMSANTDDEAAKSLKLLPHVLMLLKRFESLGRVQPEQFEEFQFSKPMYSLRWTGRVLSVWYAFYQNVLMRNSFESNKKVEVFEKLPPQKLWVGKLGLLDSIEEDTADTWIDQNTHQRTYYVLGLLHDKTDSQKALKWYREAAEKGSAWAMHDIGYFYHHHGGEDIRQDFDKALEWYLKAAEKGNTMAMNQIGYLYQNGCGKVIPQDFKEALEWYQRAAEKGEAVAMNNIGGLYHYGGGEDIRQDFRKAMECYKSAYVNGNAWGASNIGCLYQYGGGEDIRPDFNKALKWYLKAAAQEDSAAMNNIGSLYHFGDGKDFPQNFSKALKWYQRAAEKGETEAMIHIGILYQKGCGPDMLQDFDKALEWYQMAIENGDFGAMLHIGELLSGDSIEIAQNFSRAMKWYLRAAEKGSTAAMNQIGVLYRYGGGEVILQDFSKAMEWYLMAAKKTDSLAMIQIDTIDRRDIHWAINKVTEILDKLKAIVMYQIGLFYHHGGKKVVSPHFFKSLETFLTWFDKAKAYLDGHGDDQDLLRDLKDIFPVVNKILDLLQMYEEEATAVAMNNIGMLYRYGGGENIPQNFNKALEWYKMAAEKNYAIAMYNIGSLYHYGHGVEQSYHEAIGYYKKAAEFGDNKIKSQVISDIKNLGDICDKGTGGIPKNLSRARVCFEIAADLRDAEAMHKLAWYYEKGKGGVKKNRKKAKSLRDKAKEGGYRG